MTNFQNFETGQDETVWEKFKATFWSIKKGATPAEATYVQRIGAWQAMDDVGDGEKLRRMLADCRPVEAIIEAGVGTVREIGARPTAGGTIGAELNPPFSPRSDKTHRSRREFRSRWVPTPRGRATRCAGPNQVLSTREAQLSLTDPKFEAVEPDKDPAAGGPDRSQ